MKKVFSLLFFTIFFSCTDNNTNKNLVSKKENNKKQIKNTKNPNSSSNLIKQKEKRKEVDHLNNPNLSIREMSPFQENPRDKKKCPPYSINTYFNSPDSSGLYIYDSPKGSIIKKLFKNEMDFEYFLNVTEAKDGWFKIEKTIYGMENDFKIPNDQAWVHGSLLSKDNPSAIDVLDNPKNGKIIGTLPESYRKIKLLDMCGTWVKVEYNGIKGWVNNKFLCGNPLTSCC